MFRTQAARGLPFRMKEGDRVVVIGAIRIYERDGKYQLYAEEISREGAGLFIRNLWRQRRNWKKWACLRKSTSSRFHVLYPGRCCDSTNRSCCPRYSEYFTPEKPLRTDGFCIRHWCRASTLRHLSCRAFTRLEAKKCGCDHCWQGRWFNGKTCGHLTKKLSHGLFLNVRFQSFPRWDMRRILPLPIMWQICGHRHLLQQQSWQLFEVGPVLDMLQNGRELLMRRLQQQIEKKRSFLREYQLRLQNLHPKNQLLQKKTVSYGSGGSIRT